MATKAASAIGISSTTNAIGGTCRPIHIINGTAPQERHEIGTPVDKNHRAVRGWSNASERSEQHVPVVIMGKSQLAKKNWPCQGTRNANFGRVTIHPLPRTHRWTSRQQRDAQGLLFLPDLVQAQSRHLVAVIMRENSGKGHCNPLVTQVPSSRAESSESIERRPRPRS